MAKETEKAEGIVKSLRKDGKGLQFETGEWYSNKFFKGTLECEKGDKVEVSYIVNGEYANLETCRILQKGTKKEMQKEIREDVNASQLTSYAKDLVVAAVNRTDPKEKIDMPLMMLAAAKAVSEAYLAIKDKLSGPQGPVQASVPPQAKEPLKGANPPARQEFNERGEY